MTNTPTPSTSTAPPPAASGSQPAAKATRKRKPKARKPRRREGDDSDSAPEDAPSSSKLPDSTALFPGMSTSTPVVWADSDPNSPNESPSEQFTRGAGAGASRGRGINIRGRARGGAVHVPPTRPSPPVAETRKTELSAEERAQLKREKQKAKRKEAKERKAVAKEAPTEVPASVAAPVTAPAPAPAPVPAVEALTASTSALTINDTSAPATAVTAPNRAPRALPEQRPHDPKFNPRVGNFWMHDQPQHPQQRPFEGGNFWRGRGGPPRGMARGSFRGLPRGRGRGFGPFAPIIPHRATPSLSSSSTSGAGVPAPAPAPPADQAALEQKRTGIDAERWGHEGFEEQTSVPAVPVPTRPVRGRGRGGRGFVRGVAPRAFGPARLPTPGVSPAPREKTECSVTQSAADALLGDSGPVTVRLPGNAASAGADQPPTEDASATPAAVPAAVPATDADTTPSAPSVAPSTDSPMPEMMPLNPSPGPYVASDSGSISSGYVPEFYGYPGAGYYPVPPQPFTPEPGMQPGMHPMTHKQHPSFSGQAFYPGPGGPVRPRSSSPLNPYASGGTVYFLPTHLPPQQKAPMVGPDGVPRSPASDMDPALAHAHAHAHPYGYEGGYPAFYHPYNAPDGGVFYAHHPYYPHPYDPAAYGYEPAHEGEYPVY